MSHDAQPTTTRTPLAIITGGSRGLGRATAIRLASAGYRVAFTYRSAADEAQATVAQIEAAGGQAVAVQADISTTAGVAAMFEGLDAALGQGWQVDALILNAGIIRHANTAATTEADYDALFDTNVKGVFFTMQRAQERLAAGASVVLLGTGLTRMVYPEYVAYSAAKAAVDMLTRVWAKELGPRGVRVNTLAPGAIDTDMNPWLRTDDGAAMMSQHTALGRVGHDDDIADAIAALVSPDMRWVTGQRVEASGGQQL